MTFSNFHLLYYIYILYFLDQTSCAPLTSIGLYIRHPSAMATQAFSVDFQHQLQRESWALYGLGVVVIGLRLYVNIPACYLFAAR